MSLSPLKSLRKEGTVNMERQQVTFEQLQHLMEQQRLKIQSIKTERRGR